jgi:hypothetical protein
MSQAANVKKAPQKVVPTSPYTENWVNVRGIKDGMIFLKNKELVSGVKVEPRNIFILEQNQQDNIINALKNCYNTFNFEWWLVVADKPVDISIYQSQLELLLTQQTDPRRRKIVSQDIAKAKMFIDNQIVDIEFYILFKEKNPDMVQERIRTMINGFAGASLVASQVSNDDLRIVLDNFLNGGVRTDFRTVVVKK